MEGSLAGLDTTVFSNGDSVAHSAQPYNPTFPRFSDGEWQHTVQRVAAQSLITSGVDTALNGGSFKDKLAAALVSQTSRQLHAEGAHLIAKNGQVLGNPGKLLSHGAMAALSAEIADSDKVGAAAGALASGTAEGAYSGADAGVIAVQNNFLSAKNVIDMKKELEEAEKEAIYQKYGKISAENRDKATALVQDGTPFDAIGVWEELNGGVDLADSLKWATIFADLSAEKCSTA
ncbi:DUF637 domain-containing protein [Arsenophonus nasoniae]|uniref:DUF637 domain-containing protein n=1 Tax=Arsenophonus nasoniae TaxID=638 RepID=A0AA95GUK8_9GAMM|nr:DUF637 domain-containing protein [Arsenophonus nasoniae]WGM03164.1 DUF637 domain-containing protein [Arsenophonus nasoniae]